MNHFIAQSIQGTAYQPGTDDIENLKKEKNNNLSKNGN